MYSLYASILLILFFINIIEITCYQFSFPLRIQGDNDTHDFNISFETKEFHSIVELTQPFCSLSTLNVIQLDSCQHVQDYITEQVHGMWYTPTTETFTMEDYNMSRTDLINYLRNRHQFNSYLEIGCGFNENYMNATTIFDIAHCVDPYVGGTHRMTSDDFFEGLIQYKVNYAPKQPYEIIFIDGLHSAEQVVLDVENSLKYFDLTASNTNTNQDDDRIIMLHDCNPRGELYQQKVRSHLNNHRWYGKLVVIVR